MKIFHAKFFQFKHSRKFYMEKFVLITCMFTGILNNACAKMCTNWTKRYATKAHQKDSLVFYFFYSLFELVYISLKFQHLKYNWSPSFELLYTAKFLANRRWRKLTSRSNVKAAILKNLYPRKLILGLGVRETLYPQKFLPAKISTNR